MAMTLTRLILATVILGTCLEAVAQHALEVIPLRYRTAEQVLPGLRPLLEPGGTLSGQANRLIVRTSPANLAELRRALQTLDAPLRRLQISVRFDAASREQRVEARGRISNRGASVELREQSTGAGERVDQRIQVREGRRAVIYTGHSRPTRERQYIQTPGGVISQQVVIVQDQTTGFEVVPRLAGPNEVALELSGATVTARLGEWIELGRVASSGPYRAELQGVWLKVDQVAD